MNDERRHEWECCLVLFGGEGPEHKPWVTQLLFWPGTAQKAAEEFAAAYFEREAAAGCDVDGDAIYVAVQIDPGRHRTFFCRAQVAVKVTAAAEVERHHVKLTDSVPA